MGVSSALPSTVSKLELLPCSTRAGRHGPLRASSNFLTNLKRVLGEERGGRRHQHGEGASTIPCTVRGACRMSHRWVFSTDCLMDQKLTSFHLEILTKS